MKNYLAREQIAPSASVVFSQQVYCRSARLTPDRRLIRCSLASECRYLNTDWVCDAPFLGKRSIAALHLVVLQLVVLIVRLVFHLLYLMQSAGT